MKKANCKVQDVGRKLVNPADKLLGERAKLGL